jgi:hypothetical protein
MTDFDRGKRAGRQEMLKEVIAMARQRLDAGAARESASVSLMIVGIVTELEMRLQIEEAIH